MAMRHDPFIHPEPLIRRVYAYAAYRLGDGPDAEDATSAVFERAWRYRSGFDPEKGEAIAWLLGIARRCVAEVAAQEKPPAFQALDERASEDVEQRTVERLRLGAALADLEERDRDLIALRYGADLKAREIAALLGAQTNAVEVALHRVRARLREALIDDERELPGQARESGAIGRS
jgi:RNA polymerase sigma-70 factor (ECF subfamily)